MPLLVPATRQTFQASNSFHIHCLVDVHTLSQHIIRLLNAPSSERHIFHLSKTFAQHLSHLLSTYEQLILRLLNVDAGGKHHSLYVLIEVRDVGLRCLCASCKRADGQLNQCLLNSQLERIVTVMQNPLQFKNPGWSSNLSRACRGLRHS
ncbi:hypothetical protein F5878DRAFT_20590 [Lentinula raphanica]|uniref:Uncharacterized protein n=1 Tax=Lentinula raphanica TaxID=153919 RepID=A0AA38PLG0_9AGAR|nr:hypothetical protein F5878DRAFT_20590 [Lentinula raphanica]